MPPGKEGGKVVKALIVRFLKRVALSRVGQLLLVVHLCLVVYGFAQKPALGPGSIPCVEQPSSAILLAGRSYHFHYESDLIKAVTVLDLPALTVGSFLGVFAFTSSGLRCRLLDSRSRHTDNGFDSMVVGWMFSPRKLSRFETRNVRLLFDLVAHITSALQRTRRSVAFIYSCVGEPLKGATFGATV